VLGLEVVHDVAHSAARNFSIAVATTPRLSV
jgi:hypothetical protein